MKILGYHTVISIETPTIYIQNKAIAYLIIHKLPQIDLKSLFFDKYCFVQRMK